MLLAIDSGNTNIVFALFGDDDTVVGTWRIETVADIPVADFMSWLGQQGLSPADISYAIIATVVPSNLKALITFCEQTCSVIPFVVGEANVNLGVEVLLKTPSEIGADRLVNAVAAGQRYGGPLICVDFGTATTFDVIDKNGNYAGGVIAPGVNLSLKALHAHAEKLPSIVPKRPNHVIGTSTISAMQSGIFWGYVSLIEGLIKRIKNEFGCSMTVIATGGLSPLFSESIPVIEHTDVNLTLRGLYMIAQRNRSL